ncbi:hypothetical protein GGS23DRAFT_581741 [Durotheca rogersii]|uniref:uncharacterized protein n=1 Tax=Durotheca rogersii TaxID=419775 RepID=UPI00221EFAB5|nr:uncharacterized protein GGS23DRAFT_581741 [Durotheca rogersii]KAI5860235.1 hypothetical protein GGS23DRAFT_581741 [Durotheca rogersii]
MLADSLLLLLLPATLSSVSASPTWNPNRSVYGNGSTCWSGGIHSPCNGATAGCTYDGILVVCQDSTDSMVYSNMCGCCWSKGTCTYDADCNASCG